MLLLHACKHRVQVEDYFTRLVQRVAPKSDAQARAEVVVTRRFLENFSGDQVCTPWGTPYLWPAWQHSWQKWTSERRRHARSQYTRTSNAILIIDL